MSLDILFRLLLSSLCLLLFVESCVATYEDARCKCVCIDQSVSPNGTHPTRKVYVRAIPADKCTCNIMLEKEASLCPYCDCKYQVRNTTTIKVVVCLLVAVIAALTLYLIFLTLLEPLLSARRKPPDNNIPVAASSQFTESSRFAGQTNWLSGSPSKRYAGSRLVFDDSMLQSEAVHREWGDTVPGLAVAATDDMSDTGRIRQRPPQSNLSFGNTSGDSETSGHSVSEVVHRALSQQKRWKGDVETQRARVFSEHTLLN